MNKFADLFIAKPDKKHNVADFSTDSTLKITKQEAKEMSLMNTQLLAELQKVLYAHNKYSILIIFQAMDTAGKDGTIKHVMSGINPQGCQVSSFKQPSAEELNHDYLWRIHKKLPERGCFGIFNRSHYEEILVTKVHPEYLLKANIPSLSSIEDINEDFWKKRYRQINDFEKSITENGTIIIKFFLNLSKKEQKNRFIERLDNPTKNWKFSTSDIAERGHWDEYMKAYSDMLTETSTDFAPWHVIPADNKWFMRYAVGKIIYDRVNELNINFPLPDANFQESILTFKEILENEKK